MRLRCNVVVVDLNSRAKENNYFARPLKGVVSIGYRGHSKDNSGTCSVPLILIATAADKNGHKFLVEDNIERVFEKFCHHGKCTIRFKQPNKDVMISNAIFADLKNFLQVLRSVIKKECSTQLNVLMPVEQKHVDMEQQKKVIRNRNDYPSFSKSFPATLQELIIESTLCLKKIDNRILLLKKLVRLTISNHQLTEIPTAIGSTRLVHLNLSGNKISTFPSLSDCSVVRSLVTLDLSRNALQNIPQTFFKMSRLKELRISHNQIAKLPTELANLPSLKEIKADNNLLNFLFASFAQKRFTRLDLYGNPLVTAGALYENQSTRKR